jgi:hypothetical protein
MKSYKEHLLQTVEYLDEDQLKFIDQLITTLSNNMIGKSELSKLAFSEDENSKIDTAIPLDYQRRIEEIHPNFESMFHVYSYYDSLFGKMTNVAEKLILNAHRILSK